MPISSVTFYLICLVFLSFLDFFIKSFSVRRIVKKGFLFKGAILGNLVVLKHATDNLAKVKDRVIDVSRLGSNLKMGYGIDGYEAVVYQNKIVVYRKPTLFTFRYLLLTILGIGKKWMVTIEGKDIVDWYIDKQKRHIGLKSLVNEGKKDLLVFIFFLEVDKVGPILKAQFGHKYSAMPFAELE